MFQALGTSGEILTYQIEDILASEDWKTYKCALPLDTAKLKNFRIVLSLKGPGRLWVDALKCDIDGVAIHAAKHRIKLPAELDTAYSCGSSIAHLPFDSFVLRSYIKLGMLWGFLKYHHPSIIAGKLNWDAELFRTLPGLLAQQTEDDVNRYLETWVDRLGSKFPKMADPGIKKQDIKNASGLRLPLPYWLFRCQCQ